MTINVNNDM